MSANSNPGATPGAFPGAAPGGATAETWVDNLGVDRSAEIGRMFELNPSTKDVVAERLLADGWSNAPRLAAQQLGDMARTAGSVDMSSGSPTARLDKFLLGPDGRSADAMEATAALLIDGVKARVAAGMSEPAELEQMQAAIDAEWKARGFTAEQPSEAELRAELMAPTAAKPSDYTVSRDALERTALKGDAAKQAAFTARLQGAIDELGFPANAGSTFANEIIEWSLATKMLSSPDAIAHYERQQDAILGRFAGEYRELAKAAAERLKPAVRDWLLQPGLPWSASVVRSLAHQQQRMTARGR